MSHRIWPVKLEEKTQKKEIKGKRTRTKAFASGHFAKNTLFAVSLAIFVRQSAPKVVHNISYRLAFVPDDKLQHLKYGHAVLFVVVLLLGNSTQPAQDSTTPKAMCDRIQQIYRLLVVTSQRIIFSVKMERIGRGSDL